MIIHLIIVTLASLFGWDTIRRLCPVSVPGVVARVVIAVLATVLWLWCPAFILGGMAVVGILMMVGQFISVEPHWEWGKSLGDLILARRQLQGQQKRERVVKEKMTNLGKKFEVQDKIGKRIPKL